MPALVGVPTNVTIVPGDQSAMLGWSLVSGASGYRIEWESDPKPLTSDAIGVLDHGGLKNNLIYNYVTSGNVADVFAVPKSPPSGAPTWVTVTPGVEDNTLSLSWAGVTGAAEYRIYWNDTAGVTTTTRRIDAGGATSYLHQNLEAGASYHYTVTAISTTGKESAASPEAGGRAGAATGVSVTAGNGYAKITGLPAEPRVTFTTSSIFNESANPVFPLTFAELAAGQRYTFRVTPRFAQGLGRPSAPVSATITPPSTSVPQDVTLTAGRGVNHLRWNRVTSATAYTVTWSPTDPNGTHTATVPDPGLYETPRFRHLLPTPTCTLTVDHCPTYTYSVSANVSNSAPPVEVAAVSIDLRPFPPLVTKNRFVILTGLKPAGSLVKLHDVIIVSPSRDTA
ncbi:MAG: fibronectin type III domain-containing protein, partial [Nitrospiria bacterium]